MSRRGNELTRALWAKIENGDLPIDIIDWQQVRIQAAIAAMQTVDDHVSTVDELAKRCIRYADALIAELRKKGGQDE